ncbi:RDD family protein [Moritella sp. 24]|uniref:RDD family protein n=1 Tax=Moritella sp. 24 TaxID=2746230 RepID=UPI001BF07D66|nr:RDD family protein [Moritella sp. 24]QUM76271.1 RDD family protein [Moritella sp. 24]
MDKDERKWICGFWTRIGALVIDGFVLGAVGFALGLLFENSLVQIGSWGKLIGFIIAIAYFGVMNSRICNGQSLGKMYFDIKVVDSTNNTISLPRSLLRYCVLAMPFFLNGVNLDNEAINNEILFSYLIYPLSIIVFGGFITINYLYIFNRVTRQSLHDLVVGTYVVNTDAAQENTSTVWKPHLIIVSGLLIMTAFMPVFLSDLTQSEPFKKLYSIQNSLSTIPFVKDAGVTESTKSVYSTSYETTKTTYLKAKIVLYENSVDDNELAKKIVQKMVSAYPESINKDLIQVTLIYGFDIGIWSQWYSHTHVFNPSQ